MREHLKLLVLRDLHLCQPWFHDSIRRSDAESRLQEAGHTEGQFLFVKILAFVWGILTCHLL